MSINQILTNILIIAIIMEAINGSEVEICA